MVQVFCITTPGASQVVRFVVCMGCDARFVSVRFLFDILPLDCVPFFVIGFALPPSVHLSSLRQQRRCDDGPDMSGRNADVVAEQQSLARWALLKGWGLRVRLSYAI